MPKLPRLPLLASAALAACSHPGHLAVPEPASAHAARPAVPLRLMTYNVQSCLRGLDGVAQAIREAVPDLVALQEVDRGTSRSGGMDQARELGQRTGLPHAAHFRATSLYGGDYGLALLSRYPVREAVAHPLPVWEGLEPRIYVRAVLEVQGRPLAVYLTHLSHLPTRAALRQQQAQAILAAMARDPLPKVLLGDLNEGPTSGAVGALEGALYSVFDRVGDGPGGTYPLPLLPSLRLDYVLASAEVEPRASFVLRSEASDHYPLVADIALP